MNWMVRADLPTPLRGGQRQSGRIWRIKAAALLRNDTDHLPQRRRACTPSKTGPAKHNRRLPRHDAVRNHQWAARRYTNSGHCILYDLFFGEMDRVGRSATSMRSKVGPRLLHGLSSQELRGRVLGMLRHRFQR